MASRFFTERLCSASPRQARVASCTAGVTCGRSTCTEVPLTSTVSRTGRGYQKRCMRTTPMGPPIRISGSLGPAPCSGIASRIDGDKRLVFEALRSGASSRCKTCPPPRSPAPYAGTLLACYPRRATYRIPRSAAVPCFRARSASGNDPHRLTHRGGRGGGSQRGPVSYLQPVPMSSHLTPSRGYGTNLWASHYLVRLVSPAARLALPPHTR